MPGVEVQRAEAAVRQGQFRDLLAQLELRADATGPEPAGPAAASRIRDHIEDVRKLKTALSADFTALAANRAGPLREREALLNRGVRYLDKVRAASQGNTELSLEIADAYQQLGLLQETTAQSNANARPDAVRTYQKAADVLGGCAATPDGAMARQRLLRVNQRIQNLLGGAARIAASTPGNAETPPAAPGPRPRLKPVIETHLQKTRPALLPVSPTVDLSKLEKLVFPAFTSPR
jgi:hypothetical protein